MRSSSIVGIAEDAGSVQRCLRVVSDPTREEVEAHEGKAQAKDLPLLVTAIREDSPWLVTFNLRDYQPGDPAVTVVNPGQFVREVRYLLGRMS